MKLEFREAENKIVEVETVIEETVNFEPVAVDDCIFFAGSQNPDDVKSPPTLPYGPFFLRVPYENFHTYLSRDFHGDGFTYQLKPNYQFVEAETKLSRLTQIYKTPFLIYSPYARRAVDIRIVGKSPADFTTPADLNFKLKENNLADKLLLNKKFYWNVEVAPAENKLWRIEKNVYEYGYTDGIDAATYILPNTDASFDNKIETNISDGQIILKSPREFPEGDSELVKILPIESKIDSRILSKSRLRTQGDIEFVLSGLTRENYSCRFGKFGGNVEKPITCYVDEHKYLTSMDENLLSAKEMLPACSVKFSGEGIFLTDYANYVLHFLEERYPDFNWIGERNE